MTSSEGLDFSSPSFFIGCDDMSFLCRHTEEVINPVCFQNRVMINFPLFMLINNGR